MKIYKDGSKAYIEDQERFYVINDLDWDALFQTEDPHDLILTRREPLDEAVDRELMLKRIDAPISSQEVWAAGVTYYRSRTARMEESAAARGSDYYDRVYDAARPELFFKSTPYRVSGPGAAVAVRDDSNWNVPEPELTLAVSSRGQIFGYTIGNDMSSRDIEGENPLYLPQAKVYIGSCALGPAILLAREPLPSATMIEMEILRGGESIFRDSVSLSRMKRSPAELVSYLFRNNAFPNGCYLMTGTGVVPPSRFSLQPLDEIRITIEPIGTLINNVANSQDLRRR